MIPLYSNPGQRKENETFLKENLNLNWSDLVLRTKEALIYFWKLSENVCCECFFIGFRWPGFQQLHLFGFIQDLEDNPLSK